MPPTRNDVPIIAVFNASEDTVDVLTTFFDQEGFRAIGRTWPARESLDPAVALGFVAEHEPDVIVFDVSFPYEANWQRFREFQHLAGERCVPVVLTTTNKRALTDCIGSADALEIVGKFAECSRQPDSSTTAAARHAVAPGSGGPCELPNQSVRDIRSSTPRLLEEPLQRIAFLLALSVRIRARSAGDNPVNPV